MEINLKQAGPDDLPLLMEWRMQVLREVFSLPENADTASLEQANAQYYVQHLRAGSHIACLASIAGETVGCGGLCLYQEMPSPDNPSGQCAYLMNIYTRPQFRKRGVGEALIKWLTGQAAARGISKLYLETTAAGKGLYAKTGFVPMQNMMRLPDTAANGHAESPDM